MAISVKKINLWQRELENRPGTLAETLEPLARAGTNLKMVMSYNYTGDPRKAAVELFPITGTKSRTLAELYMGVNAPAPQAIGFAAERPA